MIGSPAIEYVAPVAALARMLPPPLPVHPPTHTTPTNQTARLRTLPTRPHTTQAIQRSNATNYGLAAGVWTRSMENMQACTRGIKAGTIWWGVVREGGPYGAWRRVTGGVLGVASLVPRAGEGGMRHVAACAAHCSA